MIKRKFMKYAPKEHKDEKVKANLQKHNVPVFEGKDPLKFGQYANVAKDITRKTKKTTITTEGGDVASAEKTFQWQQKVLYGGGTGAPAGVDSRNPYAMAQPKGNPYASTPQQGGSSNPYGAASSGSNPYGGMDSAATGATATSNAYGSGAFDIGTSAPASQAAHVGYGSGAYDMGPSSTNAYGSNASGSGSSSAIGSLGGGGAASGYGSGAFDIGMSHSRSAAAGSSFSASGAGTSAAESAAASSNIRSELFGSAPQRLNPDADEFDELNRTTTEMQRGGGEDDLNASNLDPMYPASNSTSNFGGSSSAPVESIAEEDELNALPSEFAQPSTGAGYTTGQQLFEDSEDEDVDFVKREIRQTKQESVESTRRALEIAREAEISGTNTLGMLGNQGERLGGSAKTVALGNVQARVGERNADELIRLNRSIFIPNISNPFNSRRRNQLKEQRLKGERAMDELEQQQLEQQQREADRRIAEGLTAAGPSYSETVMRQRVRLNRDNPERKMYQFEADSDDEALEDELSNNLDEIANATNRLHNLSLKMREEVDDQNKRIQHMGNRVDHLDMSLLKSTAKMSSIT